MEAVKFLFIVKLFNVTTVESSVAPLLSWCLYNANDLLL